MSAGATNAVAPKARLGVAFLCHTDLDLAARMVRIWHDGGAAVAIHVDETCSDHAFDAMRDSLSDLPDIAWIPRRACGWGMFSLVEATQDCAEALLARFSDVSHVIMSSASCLPLRPVSELTAYLERHARVDFIESVNALDVGWTIGGFNIERFWYRFPFSWRTQRKLFDRYTDLQKRLNLRRTIPTGVVPHLGSQWWCLTRETLSAILQDPRRAEFDRFFSKSWIPDESYFQSLVRRHSTRIESRSLTFSKFDDQGKPYIFYDDHAQQLEHSHCFVARKIWPGAKKLYAEFPKPSASGHEDDEPLPHRLERIIARSVSRRKLGRPGLYMQSRFPRKDCENGKTAAPYAVLQGFTDLFEGFEPWLAARVDGDVHGHLFSDDAVEFAGDPEVGPGGLIASPQCRDYDANGFLTSLIRASDRLQVFQTSPRDRQDLNWFIATDPNAQVRVITGAWIVPLMHSEMPFDDVRRVAARLQQVELAQLDVLRSVWVKADVEIYELAQFVERPAERLQRIVKDLSGGAWPAFDQPPVMRELDGVGRFLQTLRNAGLMPQLMGNFPATDRKRNWDV